MSIKRRWEVVRDPYDKFFARSYYHRTGFDSWFPSLVVWPSECQGPFDTEADARVALEYMQNGPQILYRKET